MAGSFVAYRLSKMAPPLAGPQGETWESTLGAAQNAELALLRVAALARLPQTCPNDGLDLLGQTYRLPRVEGQSDDSYRQTLIGAWDTYEISGSPDAIEEALRSFGVADVRVALEEQNHGGEAARQTTTHYAPGALIVANDAGGVQQILEMVAAQEGITGAGAFTATMGQAQADGTATWAWRCAAVQDANDRGYIGWWYSRFDVVLGGQTRGGFGTLSVNEFTGFNELCTTTGSFVVPAIGSTASVTLTASALTANTVVFVEGGAGYYLVKAMLGGNVAVLQNLGDSATAYAVAYGLAAHPAGTIFAPYVWGQFPNGAPGTTIAAANRIALGGCAVIGQTRAGIAIVRDVDRQAVKRIIVRWKASHGYAGRILLAYDGAMLDPVGQPGQHNGFAYLGHFIGLNSILGQMPGGGFDMS